MSIVKGKKWRGWQILFVLLLAVWLIIGISSATAPVASFTPNSATGPYPYTVQFNDTSTNTPDGWNWSFGDDDAFYPANGTFKIGTQTSFSDDAVSDQSANYTTVTGTAISWDAGQYYSLVANTDSKYRLNYSQYASGQYLYNFTLPASANDGDYINARVASGSDLATGGYGIGVIRANGGWNVSSVINTAVTDSNVTVAGLADGDQAHVKIIYDPARAYFSGTVYETTDPGTAQVTIYNYVYTYGYSGVVVHSASGSKTFRLNGVQIQSNPLIGQSTVPAKETGFVFSDDFSVDDKGRFGGDISYFIWDTTNSSLGTSATARKQIHFGPKYGNGPVTIEYDWTPISHGTGSIVCNPHFGMQSFSSTGIVSGGTNYGYRLSVTKPVTGDTTFLFQQWDGTSTVVLSPSSTPTINLGQTYRIKVVWDPTGGTMKGYVDGVEQTASSVTGQYNYSNGYNGFDTGTAVSVNGQMWSVQNYSVTGTTVYSAPITTTSTLQNPQHTYYAVGNYSVVLQASNVDGSNVSTQISFVNVTEPIAPIAAFSGTPTSGFSPLSVQFTDESTNVPTSWLWDFGDGNTTGNTEQNPVHLYTSVGSFNVNLTASNTAGSDYEYKTSYITTNLADPNPSSLLQYKVGTSNSQINNQTPYTGTGTIRNISSGITRVLTNFTWDPAYVSITDIRVNKSVANITGLAIDSSEIYSSYAIVNMSKATDFTAPANAMFDFNITYTTYAEPGTIAVFGFDNSSRYYDTANATWWPFTYRNTANAIIGTWGPITNDFSADNTSVELGTPVTFTGISTGYPDAYTWDFGDSDPTNSTEQNPVHTYTSTGTYDVSFTAYLSANVTVSNTTTKLGYVTVWQPPVANFSGSPRNGQIPLNVTFTDLSTDTTSWLWDFGDGDATNATDKNPLHTYSTVGSYNVSLQASNAYGNNTMSKTNYIIVSDLTVANFTYSPHYGATPLLVTFTDTSTGSDISSWQWDFGDGNTSILQSPTHTYDFDGEFQVNLTVSNLGGSSTKLQNVTAATFSSEYTGTPTVGPSPVSVSFAETVHGLKADSYYWIFGDGNTSVLQNPTNVYPSPGYYSVSNRVTNGSTEYWLNKTNYIEAYGIVPSFTVSNATSYDVPLSVQFTDTSTNVNATPSSYYYVFGDGSSSTERNPVHVYTTYGVFEANLTVSNATQGVSSTTGLTSLSHLSTNTVSSMSYNWVMNQVFPATIMIKDSSTLALINGASVSVDGGSPQIATNGILSQYFEYGSHSFFVSADNYNPVTKSLFIVSNSTYTIYLDSSSNTQNTLWSPTSVAVQILDSNNNPIKGTVVSTSAVGTTLPGGLAGAAAYFQNTYGMSSATASSMLSGGTLYNGTTDSYGYVVIQMAAVIEYQITVIDALGYPYIVTTYPQSSWMQIRTPNATTTSVFTSGDAAIAILKDSIHVTNLTENDDGTVATLKVFFYDASHTTTGLDCWFKAPNSTIYWQNSTFATTAGLQTCSLVVPAEPFTTWQWGGIST